MIDNPFFIVGCVRSGTTLLRDLLRQHPDLACPEETHFFRWADPCGTSAYSNNYQRKKLFKSHRELDKVADWDFFYTLSECTSRRALMDHYARIFLENNGLVGRRWFDKSPQNVYGVLLISGLYPKASFVHIHRHPYNVASSLRSGRGLARQDIKAAASFWLESLTIMSQFRHAFPDRVIEVRYESLAATPHQTMAEILDFLGEKPMDLDLEKNPVHAEKNEFSATLTDIEIATLDAVCGPLMDEYGYARGH